MNAINRRHFDSAACGRPPGAFTMVEMLAVMFIIAMLLAIGTPAALRYRAQARARATQTIINTVNGAIREFYSEHHEYPAIDNLGECLTGHRPAGNNLFGYTNVSGDGKDGFGYRMQRRGRVYGPWNGTEKLARSGETFTDSYGTEIEYYPFNLDTGAYAGTVNTYAKDPDGHYYRRDYVLRSKGENGEFETYPHTYTSGDEIIPDDITNFFEE